MFMLLFIFSLFRFALGGGDTDVITGTNMTITCDEDATKCVIKCSGDESCTTNPDGPLGCAPPIYCPTTNDCEKCTLKCDGYAACVGRTIYGNNCSLLEIEIKGERAGSRLTVYAPSNDGDLIFDIKSGYRAAFESEIYSVVGTNNMFAQCQEENTTIIPEPTEHCKSLIFDTRYAQYSNLNCINNGECLCTQYFCPKTSSSVYYPMYNTPGCQLNCTNSLDCAVDIYIDDVSDNNLYWENVWVYCTGDYCGTYKHTNDVRIYCDLNESTWKYDSYCNFTKNTMNNKWECLGGCCETEHIMPTQIPTATPITLTTTELHVISTTSDSIDIDTTEEEIENTEYEQELAVTTDEKDSFLDDLLAVLSNGWVIGLLIGIIVCCLLGGIQNMYFNLGKKAQSLNGARPELINQESQSQDIIIVDHDE